MSILRALAGVLCLLLPAIAAAQPAPLQGVPLQDQRTQPVDAAALRGRVVLLHFVFTGCSSTCPLQVKELAAVRAALPAAARAAVRFLAVSVDPAHDTPATLAAFAQRLEADQPGWHFATGRPADLERLYERLRTFDPAKARPTPDDHRTTLYLYDARGELMQRFAGVPVDRARLVREITQLALNPPPNARR